jgi:hypothetical protein
MFVSYECRPDLVYHNGKLITLDYLAVDLLSHVTCNKKDVGYEYQLFCDFSPTHTGAVEKKGPFSI